VGKAQRGRTSSRRTSHQGAGGCYGDLQRATLVKAVATVAMYKEDRRCVPFFNILDHIVNITVHLI